MNIFRKLTLQALRANPTRTIVTIVGIILSTAMMTATTSLTVSLQQYLVESAIYSSGNWYAKALNVPFSDFEEITREETIEASAYLQHLGYAAAEESLQQNKPYLYVLGAGENAPDLYPIHVTEGTYPTSNQEILLPQHYLDSIADVPEIGETITLELGQRMADGLFLTQSDPYNQNRAKGEQLVVFETRTYTVSGYYDRQYEDPYRAPGYTAITLADDNLQGDDVVDIYVRHYRPGDAFSDFTFSEKMERNTNLLRYLGASQYQSFYTMLYGLVAILLGMIIFGSVTVIYNAFSISVAERTRQFGLLSSIGATRRQLRRMVGFEALVVSAIGVPIGIASGLLGIGITLHFIGHLFATAGTPVTMSLCISPYAIAAAAILGVGTVLLSAWIPSHRATRVTAMDAIRQSQDISIQRRDVKTSRLTEKFFGLPGMLAAKYYKRSRKKYRTTVASLFMSIVIFVSTASFSDYLTWAVAGGFGGAGFDISVSIGDETSRQDEMLAEIKALPTVTDAAMVQLAVVDCLYPYDELTPEMQTASQREGDTVTSMLTLAFTDDAAYGEIAKKYGIDPASKQGIAFDGTTVFDSVQEQFVHLKMLATNTPSLTFQLVKDQEVSHTMPLPIATVEEEWPYFLAANVGVSVLYPASIIDTFGLPEESLTTACYLLSDDNTATEQELRNALVSYGIPGQEIYNYAAYRTNQRNFVTIANVLCYGFIVLISLIAVTNVFNTITTNLLLRRREFAMLQSVGMTDREFRRMMSFECVLYGTRALLLGLPTAGIVSFLIYKTVSAGFQTAFRLPLTAMLIAILFVFLIVYITMRYAMRKISSQNIIDALKNENI